MNVNDQLIQSLSDLNGLRTAPVLSLKQAEKLRFELQNAMSEADWFTLGVMAESPDKALFVVRTLERQFSWPIMKLIESPNYDGPVYLKANQQSGEIRIRSEKGLGQGFLISSHFSNLEKDGETWGPLPLDLFAY